ncbi:hypothetical protein [Mycolicibacterium sp. 050158]|uniref:hypothetical protein n=1 Tax=Mycolicibacterium sp. 050158 TaxID=3090602 RepID=UPI00299E6932|nr:hypothetical protein [Mycolicibacterium sp. 050158]MDX1888603.1 hypothetical protein [Mycolicibacterium sp. 050158]
MTDAIVASHLRRIVEAWYQWQRVNLRKRGRAPGDSSAAREPWQSRAEAFWGAPPPRTADDSTLVLSDDSGGAYFLVKEDGVFFIDEAERRPEGRYWMFRSFEDAEKCLLFLISQSARPGRYTDSPRFRWNAEGLASRVTISKPDAEHFPGRVSMRLDHEPIDRGWMGEADAIPFSHVITMSYEALDDAVREGIPQEWFEPDDGQVF